MKSNKGKIDISCGSMFSGKTEELLRRVRRCLIAKQKIQLFKPKIDQRYSEDHVQSHDSNRLPSVPVNSASELLERVDDTTRVVAIDEVQFFDSGIVEVAQKLANQGKKVICAGLDLDYLGKPFGPMPTLLCVAEEVMKLAAVCGRCGGSATRSQRILRKNTSQGSLNLTLSDSESKPSDETSPVWVGASESYEPRCRLYHEPHEIEIDGD